ncbi:MAG: ImmA/IrrE family metallo-endopeptidase [Lachnospiraceae bacterium]|nr:ImmA/IrrE family metallo-endopeptidase [Lachnospiraceae bacterium]
MLSPERKEEILEQAKRVNSVAEGYQLIHACFAVQKIINEHINRSFQDKFSDLRERLLKEDLDSDEVEKILQKKKELELENRRTRINISIRYIDTLTGFNATTTRVGTYKNSFIISLPKELEHIRKCDGEFDYIKMKNLRTLMAHELGHILLHTDYIDEEGIIDEDGNREEESNYFAEVVMELRRERNRSFYSNQNYEKM